MAFSFEWPTSSFLMAFWKLDVTFAASPASIEQIALRWIHIVAAIIWLGFLFFFVLAVAPTLKALDPATRAKVFPEIASRGLWWLRWSSVMAWLAGFRYFMILAKTDAVNAGRPHAWGVWIGIWLACWLAAFAIEMALIQRAGGALGNPIRDGRTGVLCDGGRFLAGRFAIGATRSGQPHAVHFDRRRTGNNLVPECLGDRLALSETIDRVDSRVQQSKELRCRPKRRISRA